MPQESKQNDIQNQPPRGGNPAASASFFHFTTTRPVAILMIVLGVSVFGWISYQQLALNLMPDITYPSLTVRTEYPGTAPEEVETTISRPIEQALGVVDNLVSISSISKAGQSDVKLEFTWDTDMNKASADVREMLDQVFLPDDAKRPLILRYDPTLDPILRIGLYGDASLVYLRYLAEEEIKRTLETLDGVAAVKVKGGLEEEIRVELDEQKLALIGIDIQQVRNRLAQENVNLAGGNLKEGQTEYLVRTLNEFKTVEEITQVVIGNWNGREIKIGDVAEVRRTHRDRELITRINGRESVEIQIYKEADANVVAVAERVKRRLFGTPEQQAYVRRLRQSQSDTTKTAGEGQATNGNSREAPPDRRMTNFVAYQLPEGIHLEVLSDQSVFIKNAVEEVKSTAKIGAVLAILVLFVFLRNLRSTLIVGISIPVSIIATFAAMRLFDVSLNIMSLGGLALGIGMLVDNSIVVLESIARCREEGDDLIRATIRGVSEVGSAVFASTLTTVAVFFPIVFVEGVAGQIFGDLALTVVFSLLASLAVALFLIPMLSSRQTSQFIRDVRFEGTLHNHLLQFATEPRINALLGGRSGAPWLKTVGQGVSLFLLTLLAAIWKMLQALAGMVVAFLKMLLLVALLPVVPVAVPLRKWARLPFDFAAWMRRFAMSEHLGRIRFVQALWPGFLVIRSVPALLDDFAAGLQCFHDSPVWRKVFALVMVPLQALFMTGKFLFWFLFEMAFRLWHALALQVTIGLKTGHLLGRLVLSPLAQALFRGFNAIYSPIETGYPNVLRAALQHRLVMLGGMAVLFAFTLIVLGPRLGSELIPEVHQGEFNVEVALPVGTPVEETDARILPIQAFLTQQPVVAKVASVAGVDRMATTESEAGEHTARLTVTLKRQGNLIRTEEELVRQVRSELRHYSGMEWKISRPVLFSFKTPIEVEIHGYNLRQLQTVARTVEERLRRIPGVFDVKSSMQRGNPEVQIVYDRPRLARYGLNILEVASIIRNKIRGDVATEFKDRDRKIDVLVRLRESDRQSIDDLRRLVVNPGSPIPIPLEAIAEIRVNEGPAEIRRVDQQRTAVITASISGRDLQSVSEDIEAVLSQIDMPEDFTYSLAGQNKEMQTSLNSLKFALALAIFLVYIVMASQFESLIYPFVIIFTIPLALIGVIWVLYVLNIPLSIVVFLGLIMLAGIVVNNAIVLVDYINQLRARGLPKVEAIVKAGRVRLRPILMTTATTVLGLLPMALGLGEGAEIRTPMAITVIVGLVSSTFLTLVVIPAVYSLVGGRESRTEVEPA
ncbi:MAG: efflux RND transporter permease subunit [candidate division KSB1 bacterium]|nr:efflux RND transporter permease subunit [candidate division KSB1 bacterium]